MLTSLPSTPHLTGQTTPWIGRGLLAGYLASLVAICGLLVINGPQMRAAAEAQEARIVDEENRAFCSRFGIGPETGRYAECATELREIRARYLQRSVSDSIL